MFGMSIKNEFFRMVLEQKGINKLCGLPLVVVGRMLNELSCFILPLLGILNIIGRSYKSDKVI